MKKMLSLLGILQLIALGLSAQFIFKGQVTDAATGEHLIGANVMVKGSTLGCATDIDGKFQLNVPDSCALIVIAYTGYINYESKLCTQVKPLELKLTQNSSSLYEIVVVGQAETKTPNKTRSFQSLPKRKNVASQAPGLSVRGSRDAHTNYYVDGVRVHGLVADEEFNTEDYAPITENRFLAVNKEPLSTFSIDVDAASYSNVRRFIQLGQTPPPSAVRVEEMINYFEYNYEGPNNEDPFAVHTELGPCPWNSKHQLLHVGLQGKKMETTQLPPSNLVFLIDVSGSMSDENKLPLLKSAFKLLVGQLREQDRVAIVVYAGAAGLVLPPTSGTNKQAILGALDELQAGGSTAGGAGIQLAYNTARSFFNKEGNNRVILATDGDFNVGVSSDGELVRLIEKERESGIFLSVLGFGMGNYKDNKLQLLADKGNGNHAYIDNMQEARKVLVTQFGGTLFTIAKDVKIQIEFNPNKIAGYRLVGYENRLLANEDFKDDTKDAGELGAGHTVTALYEIIPAGTATTLLADIDPLKYQKDQPEPKKYNNEFATIKLRYKQPQGIKSTEMVTVVNKATKELDQTSENFRWSSAVASMAQLLRQSEFKGEANLESILAQARGASAYDQHGYRHEFIGLIMTLKNMGTYGSVEK